ncbi:ABC transporter permease [Pseudorhodoferax sp.]|uniref:ABC transporter permease n=1 Tax=Pseudorhodoferax sp. TaxID=1993553 RepID=UPI002DD672AE|nr:ABC transporter permease [Pseudorhodoferax sp.]
MTSSSWWLFLRFAQREVTNRFAGSLLGGLWALLHPLALLLTYNFVFTSVLRVRPPPDTNVPFLVFLALALWPWLLFSESVIRGTGSVVGNAALVKKIPFAHELVVYAASAASFALQVAGFAVVLVFIAVSGYELHWAGLGLALYCLLALSCLATGLGLMLGALQVFVRDIEQGLTPILGILFYLCPIVYTINMVPEWMRAGLWLNPVATLIEALRAGLLQGRLLPLQAEWLAGLVCVAVLLLGRLVFRRLSPHFEEAL